MPAQLTDQQRALVAEVNARYRLDLSKLRPATVEDYEQWLLAYLEQGGKISHAVAYPFPAERFYVATADFVLPPLYGASLVHVIVPADIRVGLDPATYDLGHSEIFRYKPRVEVLGSGGAVLYSNTLTKP